MKDFKKDKNLPPPTFPRLNYADSKEAANILRAVNHCFRKTLLETIHGKQEATVTELVEHLNLRQTVVSLHLGVLRGAQIVTTRRDGKFIFYSINYSRIDELNKGMKIFHCFR